ISTNAICAPAWEMASVVAINVCGTVTMMSPGCTPAAMNANRKASVPLFTPTQYFVPQNPANSRSNSSTIGPPMNPALLKAFFTTARSSSWSSWCGVTRSRNGIFVGFAMSLPFLLIHESQKPSRIPRYDCVCRNVLRHHASRPDYRVFANRHIAQNRGPRTDRGAFANSGFLNLAIGFRLQSDAGNGCPRVNVIDKRHAVSDKHVVLNFHALTDESVAGDFAAAADTRVFLDFDERPDLGVVANLTSVKIDEF